MCAVEDWASLTSMPSSPTLGDLGGGRPSREPMMPSASLQSSAELPLSMQHRLPPFPSNKTPK
eukprot:scaffold76529_cov30-Prasinocladus_malaysianus.AAC.1